jgi:hypothetical protein
MNPVAHLLFGALLSTLIMVFGIENPRRRRGLPRSDLNLRTIVAVTLALALLAVAPQASRYFGDRKLDTGPLLNLFVLHDFLELLGERFRLGDGLLDPPVTVFGLGFGVAFLFLFYLRSVDSEGWRNVWRDVAYFVVIALCLVAVRALVTGKSYLYKPYIEVHVDGRSYLIIEDTVFAGFQPPTPAVGTIRDKAMAVRDTYEVLQSASLENTGSARDEVNAFLNYPLRYEEVAALLNALRTSGGMPGELASRIIAAGSLPRRDIPMGVVLGLPLVAFAVCGYLLYPYVELE